MYVDDLNLVGTLEELTRTTKLIEKGILDERSWENKIFLGLQIEHFPIGVLVHKSAYTKKILKRFYMDKTHSLSSPMVGRSLDVKMTHFVIVKMVKNYLVLKYYILVPLVHLCIFLIVLAQILPFLSIY